MSRITEFFMSLDALNEPLGPLAARSLRIKMEDVRDVRVLRRSLDARKNRTLGYRLKVEVFLHGESMESPSEKPSFATWKSSRPKPRVVIIGSGPAGLWTALRLAEAGVPSTVLERGNPIQPRRHDLAGIQRGRLNTESNYCFGEGGAGTYSDGKLYTRTKDRTAVGAVLADLVRFGAASEILVESRPHVGSNKLPKVLQSMHTHLENLGVVYRFGSTVTAIDLHGARVAGVRTRSGEEFPADAIVLACGHSARDIYQLLHASGIAMLPKGSAVGVRLEHPQPAINRIQYGSAFEDPRLPPAFYQLSATGKGRGVYSFCMCPGGFIVPAATEEGGVVVNGMSQSRRDSPFANSGLVVAIAPEDFGTTHRGPLAGIHWQRGLEAAAYASGGGAFKAPAQRLMDFLQHRESKSLPKTSYHPGVVSRPMESVFPPFIIDALREGLWGMVRNVSGFGHADAVMIAAETRTSAPVRIVRDPVTLTSPTAKGLYPAGEGAGYAGGIVSAAIDGMRIADAILAPGID